MVFYFSSSATTPPTLIYMGRDKYENEDLIKFGWDRDLWFHVDKLSSAHVYVRLPPGMAWDALPTDLLNDCAQLVKENSIEGCKKSHVVVCYTPWSNLRKTGDMDVGQVGFHNSKLVKLVTVEKRDTEILHRLRKTQEERNPDLQAERDAYLAEVARAKRIVQKEQLAREKEAREEQQRQAEARSYDRLFKSANMVSNRDGANLEEDFM